VIVVNNKGIAVGILSDGDIRRAILKKNKLTTKISKIYNKNFFYFHKKNFDKGKALEYLLKNRIFFAPILNENKIPTDVLSINYDNVDQHTPRKGSYSFKKIPVVIMAGGLGKRLKPFTDTFPKPLIPLGDKTVIEHIIDKFSDYKINKFIITLNYKAQTIKSFLKKKRLKKFFLFYIEKIPLGTAGCLGDLKKKISGNFFLSNADSIIDVNMYDLFNFHKKNNNDVTIVAALKKYEISYGACLVDQKGNLKSIEEKPKYDLLANTGLYLINSRVLKFLKKNKKIDMDKFLDILLKKKKKIKVFPISDLSWRDTGKWSEYSKLK
tara:strand:- start:369 stop:1340 length:972 start_codon:yes stop_codon:yes gene_type:complete